MYLKWETILGSELFIFYSYFSNKSECAIVQPFLQGIGGNLTIFRVVDIFI